MRFLDASAVVAAYLNEPNRAAMRRFLVAGNAAVSRLTEVEAASAFARLAHDALITTEERDEKLAGFLADLATWQVVELTADVVERARTLLVRHRLRAGDAVQLSSALVFQGRLASPLAAFVTCDRRLRDAARAERLATYPG